MTPDQIRIGDLFRAKLDFGVMEVACTYAHDPARAHLVCCRLLGVKNAVVELPAASVAVEIARYRAQHGLEGAA